MPDKKSADFYIEHLGLEPRGPPCEGYFREVGQNPWKVVGRGGSDRSACSSIYFLQRHGQKAMFHKLKSDELFFYHHGDPMRIGEKKEVFKQEVICVHDPFILSVSLSLSPSLCLSLSLSLSLPLSLSLSLYFLSLYYFSSP